MGAKAAKLLWLVVKLLPHSDARGGTIAAAMMSEGINPEERARERDATRAQVETMPDAEDCAPGFRTETEVTRDITPPRQHQKPRVGAADVVEMCQAAGETPWPEGSGAEFRLRAGRFRLAQCWTCVSDGISVMRSMSLHCGDPGIDQADVGDWITRAINWFPKSSNLQRRTWLSIAPRSFVPA